MDCLITPADCIFVAGQRGMAGSVICRALQRAGFQLENLNIQTYIIEIVLRSSQRRMLFLGSSCIYSKFAEQPIREEALLSVALELTIEWCEIAKITGIKLCEALIRRFHWAAEAKASSVTCWGMGTPLREFLHVDDLGEACVFALEHWQATQQDLQSLNVGTGVVITTRELAEAVAPATGYQREIRWDANKPDRTPKKQLDLSWLAALRWRACISLAQYLVRA